MSNDDFWKSVRRISEQQRRLPQLVRRMSGVPTQPFHAERLPTKTTSPPGTFAVLSTPLRELSPESAAALEEIIAAACNRFKKPK